MIIAFKTLPATPVLQEPWRERLMILALWAWAALLSFPLLGVDAFEATTNKVLLYQTTGLLLFVVVTLALAPIRVATAIVRCGPFPMTIVLVILLSFMLQMHGPEASVLEGIAYTVALLVAILCLSAVWTLPPDALASCFGGMSVILAAVGVFAIAAYGWPEGRLIGGMHPNSFGSIMLVGFVLSQFSRGLLMVCVRVTCVVLSAAVSSRFALIGCFLAFLVFEASLRPFSVRFFILVLAAAASLLVFPHLLADLMALDDPARNLDSGFTGRDDQWRLALAGIADAPFGLGFKRPSTLSGGHNGYLKWLLEFGVMGGGLIIASAAAIVVKALVDTALVTAADDGVRRLASARAGGLVGLAFASFFQPQIFNLGDIYGFAAMLMLFSPSMLAGEQGDGQTGEGKHVAIPMSHSS